MENYGADPFTASRILLTLESKCFCPFPQVGIKRRRIFYHFSNFYRGVAQLVAREVWDFDAAGSNPVAPTNR